MSDYQSMENQRKRLNSILKLLKERGIELKEIAAKTETDATSLSHLKSGRVKYIPDDFLEKLQAAYNINPAYIRGDSEIRFSFLGSKLNSFENVVESWGTVIKGEDKYLTLRMDKNFYDFLITYDKRRLIEDEEGVPIDVASIQAIFTAEPKIRDYVILPSNNLMEIVRDIVNGKENLHEILDFEKYESYISDYS